MTYATRTMLVTGGSRGIGAATVRLAAAAGWRVAINYVTDAAAAERLVSEIAAAGGDAFAIRGDVGEESDVVAMFQSIDTRFGRLDALVNNAGIVTRKSRVDAMDAERIQRVLRINVIGAMLCAREAVRRMSTAHAGAGGAIVNVSSIAATLGAPGEYVDYAASKAAVEAFTIGLAKEVAAEGIRVNAVRPGIIDTEIHASGGQPDRIAATRGAIPMLREGKAEEIARAILWLVSDDASYSTGAILNASGGR